ncbi:MAG: PaaX family transcriptional regulator C-terminal domain-containing protein [Rhizobiaceae bacterium]
MDPVAQLIDRLNGTNKLRVWSVIITFFGDAIVPRGGSVSARTVQNLLQRMGIEAGAVRTAFSRLTTDGWVVRDKLGRSSFYHLSPTGLRPFAEATDRIYAPLPVPDLTNGLWSLSFRQEDFPKPHLTRKGADNNRQPIVAGDAFHLSGNIQHIPDWMKDMSCPKDHRQSYEALIAAFEPIMGVDVAGIDAQVVRCLLIHEWRRILFQFDKVEPEFWTQDWPEAQCHRFVSTLYQQVLPASEAWMDAEATGPEGPLPPPASDLTSRFT